MSFRKFILVVLVGLLLCPVDAWARRRKRKRKRPKGWYEKYELATIYYKDKSYHKAERLFKEVTPLIRGRKEAAMAQFYQAYCSFHKKEYLISAFLFGDFHNTYPKAPQAEEALYMQGHSLFRLSPDIAVDQSYTTEAISLLQNYLDHYPEGKFVGDVRESLHQLDEKLARKMLETCKLYLKLTKYQATLITLENLEKQYPLHLNKEIGHVKQKAQQKALQLKTKEYKKRKAAQKKKNKKGNTPNKIRDQNPTTIANS